MSLTTILTGAGGVLVGEVILKLVIVTIKEFRGRRSKSGHDSAEVEPVDFESVLRMVHAGRRIQAVKAFREVTGVPLAEAVEIMKQASRGDTSSLRKYLGE